MRRNIDGASGSLHNGTIQRNYTVRQWDGNEKLRISLYMDPLNTKYYVTECAWCQKRTVVFRLCIISSSNNGEHESAVVIKVVS